MYRSNLLIAAALLCGVASPAACNQDAAAAYGRLAATLAKAESISFSARTRIVVLRTGHSPHVVSHAEIRYLSSGGRVRLDVSTSDRDYVLFVADGKAWRWSRQQLQYTEEADAPPAFPPAAATPAFSDNVDLAEALTRAVLGALARVPADASAFEAAPPVKLRARLRKSDYPVLSALLTAGDGSRELLSAAVDPRTGMPRRLRWTANGVDSAGREVVRHCDLDFREFSAGKPVAPERLRFDPPPNAVRVAKLWFSADEWKLRPDWINSKYRGKTLDGDVVDLAALRGHYVLLVRWDSQSKDSRRQLLVVENIRRESAPRGLIVLGVTAEDPAIAREFARRAGIEFPTVIDWQGGMRTGALITILDPETRVVRSIGSYQPEEQLRAALAAAGFR